MLSTHAAGRLLADASSLEALGAIGTALGFGDPIPLDHELSDAIGLTTGEGRAAVATGAGALRALLVESGNGRSPREVVERVAGRLASRSPHPLWIVALTAPATNSVVLATWDVSNLPPRIRALTIDRRRVVDSDASTLRALCAVATAAADGATHAAWLDLLGRDALTGRFYRELARLVATLGDELRVRVRCSSSDRGGFALLQLSRLLFLSFVEARGWLDGDLAFLSNSFGRCMRGGGDYHRRVLRPLIFGTLNTPPSRRAPAAHAFGRIPFLNGGLFARTALERRLGGASWSDASIGSIFELLLGRYRFTARENQQQWTDAAVDPEMLGRAFESLMHTGARRDTGAYYTPPPLVARATRHALVTSLGTAVATPGARGVPPMTIRDAEGLVIAALDGTTPGDAAARRLLGAIRNLRLLDPACGSGAFLVHALETLASLAGRVGDDRPVATVRRELLASGIFGVDINPMAVWLCELRLWLSVLIESEEADPMRIAPLPNLDHHIRTGDALAGGGLTTPAPLDRRQARELTRLRTRYMRASGATKRTLGSSLYRLERQAALQQLDRAIDSARARRRDLLALLRDRNLFGARTRPTSDHQRQADLLRNEVRRLRARRHSIASGGGLPFTFATHFADVAAGGGFGLVLGNPPWVRPHRLHPSDRRRLREDFQVAREAAWRTGAELAGAGAAFSAQADLASLFTERSLSLVKVGGTVGLLLPSKLWRSLAGGGVRRLLHQEARLTVLEDWSASPHSFDAAVYPSLVVATRRSAGEPAPASREPDLRNLPLGGALAPVDADRDGATPGLPLNVPPDYASPLAESVRLTEWHGAAERRWCGYASELPLGGETGAPWLLLHSHARKAFELLRCRGTPLAHGPVGRPLLGVKTGCNDAFVFRRLPHGAMVPAADVTPATRELATAIEACHLRPLVRGETVRRWRLEELYEWLLWPHAADGEPLATLPRAMERWLAHWRRRLERRADARNGGRWWKLFRTEAASHATHRVVWADMGRTPRAALIPAGSPIVPLNSCYALRCPIEADALALTAYLNSPPAAAWLAALAEPARGGYHRYLAWTLALLPLPSRWERARDSLAPLARRAGLGLTPDDDELTEAVCWAFDVGRAAVDPLLHGGLGDDTR